MNKKKHLEIIIPIYNEEECIDALFERLANLQEKLNEHISFIFIND